MLKCLSFGWRFWSRTGPGSISSLEIGIKSIIFIFSQSMTSNQMTNDSKLGIDLDKNWKMLDIVNTAKTGPGSVRLDMVAYFYWIWEKYKKWKQIVICIYKKSLQSTFDINFSLIHVCLVPIFGRQNLVPDFGPGFRALVPGFIPSHWNWFNSERNELLRIKDISDLGHFRSWSFRPGSGSG